MRKVLHPDVERQRIAGQAYDGPYGAFRVRSPWGDQLRVIVSDGRDWTESGLLEPVWEHASVSLANRCPTWQEMEWVRGLFWEENELVLQLSVPRSQHINCHQYTLHLWRPVGVEIPLPPTDTA